MPEVTPYKDKVWSPQTKAWLTMRLGKTADRDAIVQLREDAKEWLRTKNTDQWTSYPKLFFWQTYKNLRDKKTWVLLDEDDTTVISTVTLDFRPDATLWNVSERQQRSLYLSKLMVRRDCEGIGLGGLVLTWAEQEAKIGQCHFVRLDCWSTNQALRAYYKRRGFDYLRTVPDRPSGALFQKRCLYFTLAMQDEEYLP